MNEFETPVTKEPSVFEPLKVYCICLQNNCCITDIEYRSGKASNLFLLAFYCSITPS